MSKETFETEWNSKAVNFYASDPVEMIEKHGGRIVWPSEPKEPPPPDDFDQTLEGQYQEARPRPSAKSRSSF